MKIGFDGKRAVSNMTGLGNYSRLVIEALGKKFHVLGDEDAAQTSDKDGSQTSDERASRTGAGPEFGMYLSDPEAMRRLHEDQAKDWQLLVYTPKMVRNARLEPLRRLDNVQFRFPPAQGFKGALWRSFGITNNLVTDKIDLFHGLSNELPLNIRNSGVPSVVTIHDLIYRRLPYCYKPIDRILYDFKYGRACKNADRIIAVSERTKIDITDIYGIDPDKIDVIYQGCDDIFRRDYDQAVRSEVRNRLGLPAKYICQVGTVERRKNLELTLRAFSTLGSDISLVVVGGDNAGYRGQMQRLAKELGVAARVVWLQGIDFRDLPVIYTMAELSCYPSRYEGFGIPLIESLECGTPVVGATGSCLEEAAGPGGLYVDPDSPRDMAAAISRLLADTTLSDEMRAAGKRHVKKFDNSRMADNLLNTYRKVLTSGCR